MGQTGRLADLQTVAEAVVRYRHWAVDITEADRDSLVAFVNELASAKGDATRLSPPPGLQSGYGSYGGGRWVHDLWTSSELKAVLLGAGWCLRIQQLAGYERAPTDPGQRDAFIRLGLNPSGIYRDIRVCSALPSQGHAYKFPDVEVRVPPREPTGLLDSMPELLGRGLPESGLSRRDRRQTFQALDALSSFIPITVDLSWEPQLIRDSVMAQLAEFISRLNRGKCPSFPTLTEDVWTWWLNWALRISRTPPGTADLSLADILAIAARTVRPYSPSGHHKYWKESLRFQHRGKGVVDRAATAARIGRSTAYDRLRRADKSVDDFQSEADPVQALTCFLRDAVDPRTLPCDRHIIVEALLDEGMKKNSARRFERRIRGLDPKEQYRRLLKLRNRLGEPGGTHNKAPAPSGSG